MTKRLLGSGVHSPQGQKILTKTGVNFTTWLITCRSQSLCQVPGLTSTYDQGVLIHVTQLLTDAYTVSAPERRPVS